MKTCTRCGESKNALDFYGRQAECKSCIKARVAKYRAENSDKVREYHAARRKAHPEYMAQYREIHHERLAEQVAKYHQEHQGDIRQYMAGYNAQLRRDHPKTMRLLSRVKATVHRAVKRGELIRPDTCEWCGQVRFITAAHSDYSRPLVVTWLCRPCHSRWDRATPKLFHYTAPL